MINKKIKLKCSNCGKINEYNKDLIKNKFPYSRERIKCKYCKKTLSIASTGFLGIK